MLGVGQVGPVKMSKPIVQVSYVAAANGVPVFQAHNRFQSKKNPPILTNSGPFHSCATWKSCNFDATWNNACIIFVQKVVQLRLFSYCGLVAINLKGH